MLNVEFTALLYRAPELLRRGPGGGSPRADVYSFSLVLYEIHTRKGPYGEQCLSPAEMLAKVAHPDPAVPLFRY